MPQPAHTQSGESLLESFKVVNNAGLSDQEAQSRLKEFGPNEIPSAGQKSFILILIDQFINPMILLLLGVSGISLAIGHNLDAIIILIIVLMNAGIGFFQEFKAEKAMESIRDMASPTARVLRGGHIIMKPTREIVPGDIIHLEAGDKIPADVRFLETPSLQIDESILTGESVPVFKETTTLNQPELALGDRINMGFMGTFVISGRAVGLCVETGKTTELGKIAKLLSSHKAGSMPLKRRMERMTHQMVGAAFFLCLLIFCVGVWQGEPVLEMVLAALSLGVAAIPEGLPAVITISLSLGSLRLAKKGVLVRNLQAVEALGSITVICADKTGTLTQNRMAVQFPSVEEARLAPLFLETLALCNDAQLAAENEGCGDPMEIALLKFVFSAGLDPELLRENFKRIEELPFDTARKAMTTIHTKEGSHFILTKGATESVLSMCTEEQQKSDSQTLSENRRQELSKFQETLASKGLRVLAIAKRNTENSLPKPWEEKMTFLGFVGLQDPPREDVKEAIAQCLTAGIRPVMITGDYPATAKAIGRELGIAEASIFARVSPEDKLKIVARLKNENEIVAMTGDGVNDAPALRMADVGIAMGRGTDVAKEASSLILIKENFNTIVQAIGEGRVIYDNIRKFVRYMLTTNLGEIVTMLLAILSGYPAPLLPVQILWINLVTDGLPAITLGFEPAEGNVMQRGPRSPKEGIFSRGLWQHILWVGILMGILSAGIFMFSLSQNTDIYLARTITFIGLTMAQMGHILGIRSEVSSLWKLGLLSNYRLTLAVMITILFSFLLVYVPFLQNLFHTVALGKQEIGLCLIPALVIYLAVELEKKILKRDKKSFR